MIDWSIIFMLKKKRNWTRKLKRNRNRGNNRVHRTLFSRCCSSECGMNARSVFHSNISKIGLLMNDTVLGTRTTGQGKGSRRVAIAQRRERTPATSVGWKNDESRRQVPDAAHVGNSADWTLSAFGTTGTHILIYYNTNEFYYQYLQIYLYTVIRMIVVTYYWLTGAAHWWNSAVRAGAHVPHAGGLGAAGYSDDVAIEFAQSEGETGRVSDHSVRRMVAEDSEQGRWMVPHLQSRGAQLG